MPHRACAPQIKWAIYVYIYMYISCDSMWKWHSRTTAHISWKITPTTTPKNRLSMSLGLCVAAQYAGYICMFIDEDRVMENRLYMPHVFACLSSIPFNAVMVSGQQQQKQKRCFHWMWSRLSTDPKWFMDWTAFWGIHTRTCTWLRVYVVHHCVAIYRLQSIK